MRYATKREMMGRNLVRLVIFGGAWAALSSAVGAQPRPPGPPPPLMWSGTATESSGASAVTEVTDTEAATDANATDETATATDEAATDDSTSGAAGDMPVRMTLRPPPPPGAGGPGPGGPRQGARRGARPPRPPGEIRIGDDVYLVKPTSASTDADSNTETASADSADASATDTSTDTVTATSDTEADGDDADATSDEGTSEAAAERRGPPRLRKLSAELIVPPQRGAAAGDQAAATEPTVAGTLEISIDPSGDGSDVGKVTGTATIDGKGTYTLQGTIRPPRRPGAGADDDTAATDDAGTTGETAD